MASTSQHFRKESRMEWTGSTSIDWKKLEKESKRQEQPGIITMLLLGVPEHFPKQRLLKLHGNLMGAFVGSLPHLPSPVCIFSPQDMVQEGLGDEIILTVDSLPAKHAPDRSVRDQIAALLGQKIAAFFPEAAISVTIRLRDPSDGFYSTKR